MNKRIRLTTVLLASFALVGLGACSGGGSTKSSPDAGKQDTYVPEDTTQSEDTGGGGGDKVLDKYVVEDAPSCQPANEAPDRCSADPKSGSNWQPASVVTKLKLMPQSGNAGVDLDGDGEPDNDLRQILTLLESQGGTDIDKSVAENINKGELLLVQEHQGIDGLKSTSSKYGINFYLGELKDGRSLEKKAGKTTKVHLNPASFASGTFPEARVGKASIKNGKLTAGPGKIALALAVPDLGRLQLDINGAVVQANVDQKNSSMDPKKGIVLKSGNIGGYIKIKDVFGLLNSLMGECDCLGNPKNGIDLPEGKKGDPDLCKNPSNCSLSCTQQVKDNASKCTNGSGLCQKDTLNAVCGALGIVKQAPDLDLDGDGNNDVLSIGAKFESGAASIKGVAPLVQVKSSKIGGTKTVTAGKVWTKKKAYLVVHEPGENKGEFGKVLGKTQVSAGASSDVSVQLSRKAQKGETLHAVLYRDKKPKGSFDKSKDAVMKFSSAKPSIDVQAQ